MTRAEITEVHWVDPKSLIESENNPNKHSKDQLNRLASIIEYQGWRHPIIIRKETGKVIAGHGRLQAALQKKWDKVPIQIQSFDSDDQAYAFMVSDNSIASWAELDLSAINLEVPSLGPDFDINMLGIKDFELEPADKYGDKDADAIPDLRETFVKLGDLYQLGSHRLLCGDSTNQEDVQRLMNGENADITFTSPPYNAGKTPGEDGKYLNDDDEKSSIEYLDFLKSFTRLSLEHSQFVFINIQSLSGNKIALIEYLYKFKDVFADTMIWDKLHAQPAMAYNVLNSRFEYVHVFSQKANRSIGTKEFRGTVDNILSMSSRSDKDHAKIHSATFPVSFAEFFVNNFSRNLVFEPFCGSGTTLIACEKTNRRCFGMEIDPHYCSVIITRWEKFTGQKAVKLEESALKTENKRIGKVSKK